MKKLFTLFTVLLLCTASSWADNTPTETIKVSTVMPGSGAPEYQFYVLGTVNTNYWGNKTQPVSDAASKAKFAFYQVPNKSNAYYIYNVTEGQWLSYDTSTGYSKTRNFVKNSSSLNATAYWEITTATSKTGGTSCYSIRPYRWEESNSLRSYVAAEKYLNWFEGLGNGNVHNSVGLYEKAPADDDGSAWSLVSVPATLDMKLSQEIVSAETSYKMFSQNTTSSDNLITNASQLVNTWGDSAEGTAIGNLIDNNYSTFWHTSWHANASGSYLAQNKTNGTNYLEVKDVPEVDLVSFTFTRRAAADNDHVTAWAVYGVPDSKAESETSRDGLTLLGLFSTPYGSNTETKTSPAFETKGFTRFRFYADQTVGNRGYFHLSEFQMHEVTTENSNPKAEKTATAIATAKSVTTATQADINAIHNAASYYTGPVLSDETTKHYYTFKNKRSSKYAAWQNDNQRLVQHSTAHLENIWYVTDGTGANYKMHNLATSKKLNDTGASTSTSFTDEGSDWYIYKSQINTDYYVISKSDDPTQSNAWDDQSNNTNIGYWKNISGDAEGTSWTIEPLALADAKTLLNNDHLSWIKTRFIDNEGDAEGQFTGPVFEELKGKYEAAKAVYDNADATAAQVIEQYFILAAITSYPVPTPVTLPATEKVQIRSNYSAVGTSTMTGAGNYIVAADNSVANATWMKWSVARDAENDKFYWNIVRQDDNTWKFQNAGTGKYIALASGADNFTMVEGEANGTSFIIEKTADGHYAIVTHNTYKYLHARALLEYLAGQSQFYIGGANQAYWLMPVPVGSKSQNSCNDWDIMTVDIGAKDRLGAELEKIRTDYLPNIGDNPAQYSAASTSGLQELVDEAQAVYDATDGDPDYAGALSSLQEAVAGLVVNGFSNQYVYTLKNKSNESWVLYYDGSHHYANAKNYNAGSDANHSNRWAIVTRGDRKYVYNLYAGQFLHGKTGISNSYSWPLENSVVNAMEITLQEGNYAGTYKLRDVTCTGTQDYLHCNNAYTYATTNWGEGPASSWIIEKVADVTLTAEEQKAILDKIVTGPLAVPQAILANAGKVGYPLADSNVARELDAAITAVTSQSEDYTAVTDEQLAAVNTKVTAFQSENTVVLPEDGKAYRISIYRRGNNLHWNYKADGTRNDGSEHGGTFYVHRITKDNNTRFVLINTTDGKILKSNGVTEHYSMDYAYNDFAIASLNSESENGNMSGSTPAQRYGYLYMTADARFGDPTKKGNLIINENGNASNSAAPYFNGTYTSAIKFVEVADHVAGDVEAKVVAQIDALVGVISSGYPFGEEVCKYYCMAGDTKITSAADYITAINAAESADAVNAIRNTITINQPTSAFYRIKSGNQYLQDVRNEATQRTMTSEDGANTAAKTLFYLNYQDEENKFIGYQTGYGFGNSVCQTQDTEKLNSVLFTASSEVGKYTIQSQPGTCASDEDNTGYWGVEGSDLSRKDNATDGANWTLETVTSIPVTFKTAGLGYATFNCPVAVQIPENTQAYVCQIGANGNTLTFYEITSVVDANGEKTLPANTPVLLYNSTVKGSGSDVVTVSFPVTTIDTKITNNSFVGTLATKAFNASDPDQDIYSLRTNTIDGKTKVGFYKKTIGTTLAGFKAWLPTPHQTQARNFTIYFDGEDDATGIAEALGLDSDKVEIYDLSGRKLSGYQKGINIVNGKKIFK